MLAKPTLFVIGAGASTDFGLPAGEDLKRIVSNLVSFTRKSHLQFSGDQPIVAAIHQLCRASSGGNYIDNSQIDKYFSSGNRIRDGLKLATSIDAFMETHHNDLPFKNTAKLGIARAISGAEQSSILNKKKAYRDQKLLTLEDSWISRFARIVFEGRRPEDGPKIFENVAIITFNYDRCIEFYLLLALQDYFGFSQQQALSHLRALKIFHPYGVIGTIQDQMNSHRIEFGTEFSPDELLRASNQIRVLTEQIENTDELAYMHHEISESERIFFLGFAYHPQNLKILCPPNGSRVGRIYGTALGISESDAEVIENQIEATFRSTGRAPLHGVTLHREKTCGMLLDEYGRLIRS